MGSAVLADSRDEKPRPCRPAWWLGGLTNAWRQIISVVQTVIAREPWMSCQANLLKVSST